jgi:hypothetical protein
VDEEASEDQEYSQETGKEEFRSIQSREQEEEGREESGQREDHEPAKKRSGRSAPAFSRRMPEPLSGGESGDLQGLSNVESADSESVDELIEEGNAFEAGVVSGVEEADGEDGREVHTREVPEDDVPGEYLDND